KRAGLSQQFKRGSFKFNESYHHVVPHRLKNASRYRGAIIAVATPVEESRGTTYFSEDKQATKQTRRRSELDKTKSQKRQDNEKSRPPNCESAHQKRKSP